MLDSLFIQVDGFYPGARSIKSKYLNHFFTVSSIRKIVTIRQISITENDICSVLRLVVIETHSVVVSH